LRVRRAGRGRRPRRVRLDDEHDACADHDDACADHDDACADHDDACADHDD
jgi:hypothetical protein